MHILLAISVPFVACWLGASYGQFVTSHDILTSVRSASSPGELSSRVRTGWWGFAADRTPGLLFALAWVAGYVLLSGWAALWPQRHWQWLPYVALLSACVPPSMATSRRWFSITGTVIVAFVAAASLTPKWESLWPSRAVWISGATAYFVVLVTGLRHVASRASPRALIAVLASVAAALAMVLAGTVSIRYGQVSALAASAFGGVALARNSGLHTGWVQGVVPGFALVVGGMSYVGCLEPEPPMWALLSIPGIPLVLGRCADSRGTVWHRAVREFLPVAIALVVVTTWIVLSAGIFTETAW